MDIDILVVDDEAGIRNLIQGILKDEGYGVRLAQDAQSAYQQIEKKLPDLIILDIWLQGSHHDGLQILENIKKFHKSLPVLMISGHGTIETAVSAIKQGAYDFIEKPFKSDRLLLMIDRALENAQLRRENENLRLRAEKMSEEMAGSSPIIQNIQQMLEKVAPTNSRVLITGEAGTGKNLAARHIHATSKRSDKPFIAINCATFHPERLEVEIFGSIDGILNEPAKLGALSMADGGTLLLDEVVDLPVDIQGKLLRCLQEDSYIRIGDNKKTPMNVRIIATTSRHIENAISEAVFRQDLYYRLNVVSIHMPPLRKRANDIPVLVDVLAQSVVREGGLKMKPFTDDALQALQRYEWPGNIRQLRNVIEWVSIMNMEKSGAFYDVDALPPEVLESTVHEKVRSNIVNMKPSFLNKDEVMGMPLREAREMFEREYLLSQVNRFGGNISKTAQFVGMERSALHRKLKTLEVGVQDRDESEGQESEISKRA